VWFRRPIEIDAGGKTMIITRRGIPQYYTQDFVDWLPVTDVVTPRKFSLKKFAEQFDFSGAQVQTMDWHNHVRDMPARSVSCGRVISKLTVDTKGGRLLTSWIH
jgi:hypothetical protein